MADLKCVTGGHLKPDYYYSISNYAVEHGVEAAAEVAEFEHMNLQAVSKLIVEQNIDCDFILTRAIDVQLGNDVNEKVKAAYERLRGTGIAKDVFAIPDKFAEKVRKDYAFKIERYSNAIVDGIADFWREER